MKKSNYLIVTLLSLGLIACGGGSDDDGGDPSGTNPDTGVDSGTGSGGSVIGSQEIPSDLLAQINNVSLKTASINDAVGLIITDNSGEAKTISPSVKSLVEDGALRNFEGTFSDNTLYKITADGTISEVALDDDSGSDIRGSLTPTQVVEMGNGWTLLTFETTFKYIERNIPSIVNIDGNDYIMSHSGAADERATSIDDVGFDYYVRQEGRSLAYLVHNETGNAYEAEWALGEEYANNFVYHDFGDDDVYDVYKIDTSNLTVQYSSESVGKAQVDAWSKYERFPGATFDEQGKMYVAGNVFDYLDTSSPEWPQAIYKTRVLRIDTDNVGAETLTAEVIQTTDLETTIHPTSIAVSADGQILYYSGYTNDDYSEYQRIVNLRDNASYAVQSIENGGPALRGKDGSLYSLNFEEFTTAEYDGLVSASVISRYSLVEGENKPVAEPIALLNEGKALDVTEPPFISNVGTLSDWNELKSLITDMPTFANDSQFYSWYDANVATLVSITDASSNGLNQHDFPTSAHNRHIVSGNVVIYDGYYNINIIDLPNAIVKTYSPTDLGFSSYNDYAFNNDSLFFFGKGEDTLDRIARWTPEADVETVKVDIDTDTFDVTRFKVLNQDSVMFEANVLNPFSDGTVSLTAGAKVLAEATFDGQVTIVDTIEAGEAAVLVMERISQGDFIVVDGNPSDWPTDYRSLTDATADTTNAIDGDLQYLSAFDNDDYLWILIEGNSDFSGVRTIISLDANTRVEIQSTQAYYVDDLSLSDDISLASLGGIKSLIGNNIELRLPKTIVPSGFTTSVTTEIDMTFGQVSYVSEVIDTDAETVSITINLDSPLGSVEGEASLLTDYAITITDDNWDETQADTTDDVYSISVWDDSGDGDAIETALATASGNYSVSGNEVTITLPYAAIGIVSTDVPTSLSVTVDSNSEVIAVPVDTMD